MWFTLLLLYVQLCGSARLFQRVRPSVAMRSLHPVYIQEQEEEHAHEISAVKRIGESILTAHYSQHFNVLDVYPDKQNDTALVVRNIHDWRNSEYSNVVRHGGDAAKIIFYDGDIPYGNRTLLFAYNILSFYKSKLQILVHIFISQGLLSADFVDSYVNYEETNNEE